MNKIFTTDPRDDPGDKYDKFKWDFSEKSLKKAMFNGHLYKVNNLNSGSLEKLYRVRLGINNICEYIHRNVNKYSTNELVRQMLLLFLDTHYYGKTKYILSELPDDTPFNGINKPRGRYIDKKAYPIGGDGQLRASYKDVFFNLQSKEFKDLVIHELAHTMANHVTWKDNNHYDDFKFCENIIKDAAHNARENFMD